MYMPAIKRQWTVADLEDLPDDGQRYEVIDGELFVTPSPSLRHQAAVGELHLALAGYLERHRVGHVYVAPGEIVWSPRHDVQPDVFVVPLSGGRRVESFRDVNRLLLAVEVLSPSTARADRVVKRTVYREFGVAEYWIVDLEARTIERSTPSDPRPEILANQLEWLPEGATAPLLIDLDRFFERVLDQ